jgi:peptidoglycan/LPS O-acetylase OafA/YrhL
MKETIGSRFDSGQGFAGFDYLRIGLSAAICLWHSWWVFTAKLPWDLPLWRGWLCFVPQSFVPMFFALSGFLVAGSLERNRLHHFLALRILRIVPALAFEIIVSACLIGALFTSLPFASYFSSSEFWVYFLNVVGVIHVTLPGVFPGNPVPGLSNPQLWTVPFELECYAVLGVLSLLGFVWKRNYLLLVTLGLIAARTLYIGLLKHGGDIDPTGAGHFTGRILVLMFLIGVLVYRYRGRIPYSDLVGLASLLAIAVLFRFPALTWLASLPTAYFVAWIGLKKLSPIPFGDLSYGVYLFHFPISQMLMSLVGGLVSQWWLFGLISLVGSAACAAVSWKFIERPLLARKRSILGTMDDVWSRIRACAPRRRSAPAKRALDVSAPPVGADERG